MTLDDAIRSLRDYADHGVPVGGFLSAVLCNDLHDAVSRADESSYANLRAICIYAVWKLPAASHGSRERVAAWLEAKSRERAEQAGAA